MELCYLKCAHKRSKTFSAEFQGFSFNADFLLDIFEETGGTFLDYMSNTESNFYVFDKATQESKKMIGVANVTRNDFL